MLETPILFLVFNRPDCTKLVFEQIRAVKPRHLFIAADGPRDSKPGEKELCDEVRKIVQNVDWTCDLKLLFRDNNLGCGKAVSGAIDWFFTQVDEGIILEDDCLPDSSFFSFCAVNLEKHRKNENIFMISGSNFSPRLRNSYSYHFSAYGHIWGWATWKRAWSHYDFSLKNIKEQQLIQRFDAYRFSEEEKDFWLRKFHRMKDDPIDTWDFQWLFSFWNQGALSITPSVNLVSNIGFNDLATHTHLKTKGLSDTKTKNIGEIRHPKKLKADRRSDKLLFRNYYDFQPALSEKLRDKIMGIFKKRNQS